MEESWLTNSRRLDAGSARRIENLRERRVWFYLGGEIQ
jgi:hypothetical protein